MRRTGIRASARCIARARATAIVRHAHPRSLRRRGRVEGGCVRRCVGVDRAGRRGEASGDASRLRSRRHGGLRDRAPRAAARLARELCNHVLDARRCARQRLPGQVRRHERRQRVVVQPAELRFSGRVAPGHDQEAADRVRVGTGDRPRIAARGNDRDRDRGRKRRGPWRGLCKRPFVAGIAVCVHAMAAGEGARVVFAAGCGRRSRCRRQDEDAVAQQGRARTRAMAEPRFRTAARVRRSGAELGSERIRVTLRRAVFR